MGATPAGALSLGTLLLMAMLPPGPPPQAHCSGVAPLFLSCALGPAQILTEPVLGASGIAFTGILVVALDQPGAHLQVECEAFAGVFACEATPGEIDAQAETWFSCSVRSLRGALEHAIGQWECSGWW
jgi:hypothetical protein